MMITIFAALAAAQAAPAPAPAPKPTPMAEHSEHAMKDCCCCKTMKSKMDSEHAGDRKDEHQGHAAH
jgi:hypothetical protein